MKRKTKKKDDIVTVMTQVQEQLAVLDNKLDAFMTKSLTELAQALAVSRPAPVHPVIVQNQSTLQPTQRSGRPMYAVVCFECGEDCEIPFKPSGNRPVYCRACFAKRKNHSQKPSMPVLTTAPSFESSRLGSPIISAPNSKTQKKAVTKKTSAKKKASPKKKTGAKKKSSAKKKTTPKKKVVRKKTTKKKKSKIIGVSAL